MGLGDDLNSTLVAYFDVAPDTVFVVSDDFADAFPFFTRDGYVFDLHHLRVDVLY